MIIEDIKNHITTGVDAKILQYEENALDISDDKIDLVEILGGKQNCILINMERDVDRYKSALKQLEKVSIKNFVHLKGTDGRNKDKKHLEDDLTYILQFLSQFNTQIEPRKIRINDFSEINDPGVQIQDGPLGCYCSHLRALIYAYLNFEDYVIICEDDISITNTEKIEKYIKQIPNDWDIICLNSRGKNISYGDAPFYKFTDDFHSLHFYIVKIEALTTIFKNMYPMPDQVDVLMSDNMVPRLNIYNIPDTVYQKNLETNTQSNLNIIFSSPNYKVVTDSLNKSEELLNHFANIILPDNEEQNKLIVKHIMYDVIYNFMLTKGNNNEPGPNIEDYIFNNPYEGKWRHRMLVKFVAFFLQCSKKGIDPKLAALNLVNVCLFTLNKFTELHGDDIKAYSFGSTAHTYRVGDNLLLKRYNQKLRWSTEGHDDPKTIMSKELEILNKLKNINSVPKVIDNVDMDIIMEYRGESIYNDFKLPDDWKNQIVNIFSELTDNGIFYPEFRLQNILVLDGKISFVDFGLAEFRNNCDNTENIEKFIKYLSLLDDKFKVVTDLNARHILISTFLKNVL
jgi:GR25 family glycosyltransferase involved in LPS biosynthesis/tRNA A-37 threonylcarbamoyl transferase component Bud32